MNVVIFDLDGTLRTEKQSVHLHPGIPTVAANWLEWQDHINENGEVIRENKALYDLFGDFGHKIIILTSSQHGTDKWLFNNNISLPYKVIERQSDNDKDPVSFKSNIIEKLISDGVKITHWVDNSELMCGFVKDNYSDVNVMIV